MPDPIGPNSFIVLRVVGAAVLFWLLLGKNITFPERQDWWRFLLCAICGVCINQLLFFNGLALTSPINAAIIMTSNPILVMVISAFFLKQKITALKVLGVMLGAAGAVMLLQLSTYDLSKQSSWQGDMCILINSLSWAFYLVMVKPLMKKYDPIMITAWVFLIGIFLVLPFGGSGAASIEWMQLTAWQWFSILYVIVCVTFLTYLLNMIGVHYSSPTLVSAYIYFQPMLAGIFAWLFSMILNKDFTGDITWAKVGCALLIFGGVYLVGRSEKAAVA